MNQSDLSNFIIFFLFFTGSISFVVVFISSFSYMILTILSYFVVKKQSKEVLELKEEPPVSLIIPFFNEESNIVDSIYSFLKQTYQNKELIVINDGSTDKGLDKLIKEFKLARIWETIKREEGLPKVKAIYENKSLKIRVIDKENGGKSDALNCGIKMSKFEFFCSVDGDSILVKDALKKAMLVFEKNKKTLAVGSSIQVVNGSSVVDGELVEFKIPNLWIEKFQFLEYIKSFFIARVGLEGIKSNIIISGAFGVFKKETVEKVGGYSLNHLGEDMDLVVKIFKSLKPGEGEVHFISEPLCLTLVPHDISSLKRQRVRWQKGLLQSLFKDDEKLVFRTSKKLLTLLIVPYFILTEILTPVSVLVVNILVIAALYLGVASFNQVMLIAFCSLLYNVLLTLITLFIKEYYFPKNISEKQLFSLILFSVFESFGYRQLISFFKVLGMTEYLQGKVQWGIQKRKKF